MTANLLEAVSNQYAARAEEIKSVAADLLKENLRAWEEALRRAKSAEVKTDFLASLTSRPNGRV